jgi:hypothetical protein
VRPASSGCSRNQAADRNSAASWPNGEDPGGRAYSGLARFNLAVPPYDIVTPSQIVIGRNAGHKLFSLTDIEAI